MWITAYHEQQLSLCYSQVFCEYVELGRSPCFFEVQRQFFRVWELNITSTADRTEIIKAACCLMALIPWTVFQILKDLCYLFHKGNNNRHLLGTASVFHVGHVMEREEAHQSLIAHADSFLGMAPKEPRNWECPLKLALTQLQIQFLES